MTTVRERGARYLFVRNRPLTMRERRLFALAGALAVVIVVVQLVQGAWVMAAGWTLIAATWVGTVVGDARRSFEGGR